MSAASEQHATNAPALPHVGIHSLPTELKQHTVRICDAEGRRFRQALGLREDGTIVRSISLAHEAESRTQLARIALALPDCSIGALFQVSREWSEVAAPYRFATLKLSRLLGEFFTSVILPKRRRHFVTLIVDGANRIKYGDLDALVSTLRNLPTMRRMVIDPPLTVTVNGRPYRAGPGRALRVEQKNKPAEEALLRLCSSASELDLLTCFGKGVTAFLNDLNGQNLRRLRLVGVALENDWLLVLSRHPVLASLSLSFEYPEALRAPHTSDADTNAAPAPLIRHLAVDIHTETDEDLPTSVLRLIEYSADTLVCLEFRWTSVDLLSLDGTSGSAGSQTSDRSVSLGNHFQADFPRMRHLTLEGEESKAPQLLQSITLSRFPSLHTLDLRVFGADSGVAGLPDTVRVNMTTQPPALTRAVALLTFQLPKPTITIPPVAYLLPTAETRARTTDPGSLAVPSTSFDVQRTLDFISQRAANAYSVNARAAFTDIAEQLKTFEQQRVLLEAWTDLAE